MDLTALLADLRKRLGDETATGIHSTANLTSDLNDALESVDARVNPVRKYTEETVAAATMTVALPTDFRSFADGGLAWKESDSTLKTQLQRVGVLEIDRLIPDWDDEDASLEAPKYYLFEPSTSTGYAVSLVPASNVGGTLYVDYHPTVTALSAGTDKPWGNLWPEHHRVIVRAAEVLARQREGNAEEEGKAIQRREEAIQAFDAAVRAQANPRSRTVLSAGYRSGFRY